MSMKFNRTDYDLKYSNHTVAMVQALDAAICTFIGGRGLGKTTEILAYRVMMMAFRLPRFSIGYMADTFVNLQTNLIPTLIMGLERWKVFEGVHFVVGKEPPDSWPKPMLSTGRYQNTLTFWTGFKIYLLSADRPSLSAGLSLAHIICEEAKYIKKNSFNRLMPTLRDNPLVAPDGVHYFQGMTITTDMPNIHKKSEYDWVMNLSADVTTEQNELILQTYFIVNDILTDLVKKGLSYEEIKSDKNYIRWNARLDSIRIDSAAFYRVSSFANLDVLKLRYFTNLFKALDFDDFKSSVLSIESKRGDTEPYFPKFDDKNIFSDGYQYERHYDNFGISDTIKQTAKGLRYYNPRKPLYAGMDFGNMNSIVFTQEEPMMNRAIKEMCILNPDGWFPELAKMFVDFFDSAQNKNLHLYYDRAGNNYDEHGMVKLFKKEIEKLRKGWIVHLESLNKATVYQTDVYKLFQVLFDRSSPFTLILDEYNCRDVISSIELSPARRVNGLIKLDKSSEKNSDLRKLPSTSTNYATAYIYLIEGRYSKYLPTKNQYSKEAML